MLEILMYVVMALAFLLLIVSRILPKERSVNEQVMVHATIDHEISKRLMSEAQLRDDPILINKALARYRDTRYILESVINKGG